MDNEAFIKFEKSAKLELSEKDRESVLNAVNGLFERFDTVADFDVKDTEPLISVLESQKNILRADEARKLVSRDELLKGAPETYDGCFAVPKTVE